VSFLLHVRFITHWNKFPFKVANACNNWQFSYTCASNCKKSALFQPRRSMAAFPLRVYSVRSVSEAHVCAFLLGYMVELCSFFRESNGYSKKNMRYMFSSEVIKASYHGGSQLYVPSRDSSGCYVIPGQLKVTQAEWRNLSVIYSRRRSLKPNTHRRRRRDATVELSRVGGVYWA